MRKIKGFKLVLRPHEVKRRSKKAGLDLEAAGLPDPALQKTLELLARAISPGVIFETFGHPDPDQQVLSPMPGLAYSVILASLGGGFAPAKTAEATVPESLWPILEATALDECVRFASGIIAEEAAKDNCELSPINTLSEGPALEVVVRKLDGPKLGVSFVNGALSPSASLAVSLSWLAKSKTKGRK